MWQQLIIALLVVCAAGYVVWTFLSMTRRQRLLDALAAHGVLARAAARHRARLATPGCGNCAAAGEHGQGKASGRVSIEDSAPAGAVRRQGPSGPYA